MKKKITLMIVGLVAGVGLLTAQDNQECMTNLSIFAEHAKVKNYDAAYEPWMKVRKDCPKLNVATFSYGEKILKHKIKNASAGEKTQYVNSLLSLYDEWLANFPSKKGKSVKGSIISKKGQAMVDYKKGSKKDIYDTFDKAYTTDKESFSYPKSLYYYFSTLYDLYKTNGVSMEQLFDKYEDVSEKFEDEGKKLAKKLDVILNKEEAGTPLTSRETKNKRVYNVNSTAIGKYSGNMDAIIAKESTCENLIPLYKRNFDANKNNALWIKRAASRMDAKDCSDDPLFVELVEALHALEPSAKSAYYLGFLNDKKGKTSEAIRYYEESINLETDGYEKAKTLYKIATKFKKRGQKSKARSYARQALKFQPSMGKAYLLIANLYASSANQCGNTQFEKRAVYWLAANTARKAGNVDASVKSLANKTAASYSGRAPSKTDIFTEGMQGKTVTFNCWIGSSVKVPNL